MPAAIISVIVPVYNVEPYLDRCVQSIVDQTYKDLEIILVDDGSPDNCPAMCDAWAKRDNRIRVIHKPNGGLSDARNAGMAVATGEYIAFVDSDDWIASEMLERLYQAIQEDQSDIAACAVKMVWEDGSPSQMLTVQKNCVLNRQEAQMALLKEKLLKQPVWYKLYKTDIIKNIPFEVGKYHEDVFWSYQAVGAAEQVSLIDYIGYFYTQRYNSIMGESYSLKRMDAVEAMVQRQEYLEKEMPGLAVNGRINLLFSSLYHGQMALKHLSEEDQAAEFEFLENAIRKYPLRKNEDIRMKLSHRFWTILTRFSLKTVCRIRNAIGIGL